MFAYSWIFLGLLGLLGLLAPIVALTIVVARSRRTGDGASVVKVTLVVASVWAALCAVTAVVVAVTALLPGAETGVTFPVEHFWPTLPDGMVLEGMTATLQSGGFDQVTGTVSGLSLSARLTLAISGALWLLVPGAIAGLIALACYQLLKGRAFAPLLVRMTMATAVVVALGGFSAQVLGDIGASIASSEVLEWTSAVWEDDPSVGSGDEPDPISQVWPRSAFFVEIPFWPLAAGLGFAALATIFRYGDKLQRDTEGLV